MAVRTPLGPPPVTAFPNHDPLSSEFLVDASWRLEQPGLCIPVWPQADSPRKQFFPSLDIRILYKVLLVRIAYL